MAIADVVPEIIAGRVLAPKDAMTESRLAGNVILLRERYEKLDHRNGLPSILARPLPASGRIVLFVPAPTHEPHMAFAAGRLVSSGLADAVVISGVEEKKQSWLQTVADETAHYLAGADGTVLTMRQGTFSIFGANLPARVMQIASAITGQGAAALPTSGAPLLMMPAQTVDAWIDAEMPPMYAMESVGFATQLELFLDTQIPHGTADRQTPEDAAMLRKFVLVPMLDKDAFKGSRALTRIAADTLGYRLWETVPSPTAKRAIILAPAGKPRPIVVVARENGQPRVLEAPHAGREELRDFAVRAAFAIDAHSIILGLLTSAGHVYHGDAFRSAHQAASDTDPATILVREGIDAQGVVSLGPWGPDSEKTLAATKQALYDLGFVSAEKPLDPASRDIAARTVLGGTHMVGITTDAFSLEVASLDEARLAHRSFGDKVPFVDGTLAQTAQNLWRLGPLADAPDTLRPLSLSAAQEQSVVARRNLNEIIAAGMARGAFVRTRRGQFLLVVSKHGALAYAGAVALHPVPIPNDAPTQADTFAQCEELLLSSGACEVKTP
jgi:hypothetical protein